MKHIILIGFMGSGKSTLGKMLADKLDCPFVDTDHYIEEREGRLVRDIFATDGEEYFRSVETNVLKELLKEEDKKVLALGGGTPLREENRAILKDAGYVIFLKITPDEAYDRLKDDKDRPLLQVSNPKEKITELLEVRNPIYEAAADCVLPEEKKDLKDVFDEVMEIVRKISNENFSN